MTNEKLNGSIDALALAFKDVIKEAVVEAVSPIYEKVCILEAELRAVNEKLDRLEERVTRLEERMDRLEERMDRLEERMDRLEERMDRLEARMDRMEERMDRLEARMDRMEARMDISDRNVAAQFAAQAKYISEEIDKKLGRLAVEAAA